MPQQQAITLQSPGFWGVNTQDAPLDLDPRFASEARNCVIDRKGRIAARKGTTEVSTNGSSVLGSSNGIEFLREFLQEDGTTVQFSAGNNKIFTGTTTLVDVTPGATTVTDNDWYSATLSNKFYLFQEDHEPLVYTPGTGLQRVVDATGYTGTVPEGDVVLAAFGRLFVANTASEKSVVYWSDLLNGVAWSGGSSGSIDLRKHWPRGYDEIEALIAHNNRLVIFGKTSTLVFTGADSPATMQLTDIIENIGCVARNTAISDGKDVFFLSASGLRTLGRTIQEESAPIGDVSKNVNDDVKEAYQAETRPIRGHYNEDEGFYVLSFPSQGISYVFDTRYPLQDFSLRTTTWNSLIPLDMTRTSAGDFYIGTDTGIEKYEEYLDKGTDTYEAAWYTHPLSFGLPSNLKFLKNLDATIEGGSGYTVSMRWGWDYQTQYSSETFTLGSFLIAEYGIGEYNVNEYSSTIALSNESVAAGGSGKVLTVGIEVTINQEKFSIQQVETQATIGRIV